jgi:hypothetical protein
VHDSPLRVCEPASIALTRARPMPSGLRRALTAQCVKCDGDEEQADQTADDQDSAAVRAKRQSTKHQPQRPKRSKSDTQVRASADRSTGK